MPSRAGPGPLIILGFVAFVAVVWVLSYAARARRRQTMAALARRLGFAFDPVQRRGAPPWGAALELFRRGHTRRSRNHLAGYRGDFQVEVFDYLYDTGGGKNRSTHVRTVVSTTLPQLFPDIMIGPDTALREFFEFLGGADIDFESDEFNKRYLVKSSDRQFAYQLIDPQMMQLLLDARGVAVQLSASAAIFFFGRRLKPDEIVWLLDFPADFHQRIPDYVKKDYARG